MARGTSKSDVELQAKVRERVLKGKGEDAARDDADINLVREMLRSPGAKKQAFVAFNNALEEYVGGLAEEGRDQKKVRQDLVEAFDKLPEDLRSMLTAPRELIDELYRGATHFSNAGPDGTINASFTKNREHAEFFVQFLAEAPRYPGRNSYKRYPEEGHRVYSAKDIASFGRIIDISRASKLRSIATDFQNNRPAGIWRDEEEYMVTDIKWRKDA